MLKKPELSSLFYEYVQIFSDTQIYSHSQMQERFEDKKGVLSMCEDVCFLQDTQEKTAYFRHFLHVEDIENVMLYRGV